MGWLRVSAVQIQLRSTIMAKPPLPQLEIPEDLEAVYANMVRIMHMPSEMVFDFALKLPGRSPASIQSRVMLSPVSAKLFFRALGDNLAKYEATFGEIRIPGERALEEYSKLFRPPQSPDDPEGS
jgi:hypothetical protein